MTPLHLTDRITLYLGDARDILPNLDIQAIITDPPYGINYQHKGSKTNDYTNTRPILHDDEPFDTGYLIQYALARGDKFPLILWGSNHYANRLPDGQWLCWDKSCGTGPHTAFVDSEYAFTFRKTPRTIYHHIWMGFIREGDGSSSKQRRIHPSQKPVELMQWCMETARVGLRATVCDPYMGSGTTGIACLRTGRKFIGIEKDPYYFDLALQRLRDEITRLTPPT